MELLRRKDTDPYTQNFTLRVIPENFTKSRIRKFILCFFLYRIKYKVHDTSYSFVLSRTMGVRIRDRYTRLLWLWVLSSSPCMTRPCLVTYETYYVSCSISLLPWDTSNPRSPFRSVSYSWTWLHVPVYHDERGRLLGLNLQLFTVSSTCLRLSKY